MPLFFGDQAETKEYERFTFTMLSLEQYELDNGVLVWIVFILTIVYSMSGHILSYNLYSIKFASN